MSVSEEPKPEELVAEAEGDSLGEAKWAAMKNGIWRSSGKQELSGLTFSRW